jgi:hypothetical protein
VRQPKQKESTMNTNTQNIYEHALILFNGGDTMHYSIAKALIFLEVDSLNFKQYNIILDMLKASESETYADRVINNTLRY